MTLSSDALKHRSLATVLTLAAASGNRLLRASSACVYMYPIFIEYSRNVAEHKYSLHGCPVEWGPWAGWSQQEAVGAGAWRLT